MTAAAGFSFSPYIQDSRTASSSAPERCIVSFFDRPDRELILTAHLPERNALTVQVPGAGTNETLLLEDVRMLRLVEPVDLRRSIEHFRKRGIEVHTGNQRMPFSVTFRNGQVLSGELFGYGAYEGGLGLYLVGETGAALRCFLPGTAVDSFSVGDPIGKLLLTNGQLTEDGLNKALQAQQDLRSQKLGDILTEHRIISRDVLEEALRAQSQQPIRRIGEVMLEMGILSPAQLEAALAEQKRLHHKPLGEIIVGMGLLDKNSVRQALAHKLGIPHVDLGAFRIDPDVFNSVPPELIKEHKVVPLYRHGNALVVAMSNPLDAAVLRALSFAVQGRIIPVLASSEDIETTLQRDPGNRIAIWEPEKAGEGVARVAGMPEPSAEHVQDAEILAHRLNTETSAGALEFEDRDDVVKDSDSTLVQLVNKIILDAHQRGVSDIHIDSPPGSGDVRVRFRIDGVLQDYLQVPVRFRRAVISRIKIMANLDISERRKPQDGKISFRRFGPASIELRVATIPTHGDRESAVLRILSSGKPRPLDQMNFAPDVLRQVSALAQKPYGLLLVCGPTGSGKTTTLHSILGHINTPERKIWTAEDPVEITQSGLAQVQVNQKLGWTFAAALRAFLRADPDVIMVGEMRDPETARTGVEASLTGHLVLSTLHTNSAPEAVIRLLDMGLDPFNFADALLGILAQRLVRRLCPDCHHAKPATEEDMIALAHEYCLGSTLDPEAMRRQWQQQHAAGKDFQLMHPVGCAACHGTGYRGRLVLHELLVASAAIRHLVRTRAPVPELAALAAAEGMRTLKQDGIEKLLQGHTTLEQVRSACV